MGYTVEDIGRIVDQQRAYFRKGETLDVKWRIAQLKRLKKGVMAYERAFEEALQQDLGRSAVEGYLCGRMNIVLRLIAGVGAFLLIDSGLVTDIAGIACLAVILLSQKFVFHRQPPAAKPA